MSCLPDPSKPPTPAEYAVIAVALSGLLIVFGLVGFGFSFFAPPQKHEVATALAHYSGWSLGIGSFIGLAFWLIRRISD